MIDVRRYQKMVFYIINLADTRFSSTIAYRGVRTMAIFCVYNMSNDSIKVLLTYCQNWCVELRPENRSGNIVYFRSKNFGDGSGSNYG